MKPVDYESFQRKKYIKEGDYEKNDYFGMEALEESAIQKASKRQKENPRWKKPTEKNIWGNRRWLYLWIKNKIPKSVPYKMQSGIQCSSIHSKRSIWIILKIANIKREVVVLVQNSSKRRPEKIKLKKNTSHQHKNY